MRLHTNESKEWLDEIESIRYESTHLLPDEARAALGQFFTSLPTAELMASMFTEGSDTVYLLDPGAGIGLLTAAFVDRVLKSRSRPRVIHVTAIEID